MDAPRIASSTRALRHVFLRDLVLSASIGVYPHEHAARQRVRINVDLGVEDDGARALSRANATPTIPINAAAICGQRCQWHISQGAMWPRY